MAGCRGRRREPSTAPPAAARFTPDESGRVTTASLRAPLISLWAREESAIAAAERAAQTGFYHLIVSQLLNL